MDNQEIERADPPGAENHAPDKPLPDMNSAATEFLRPTYVVGIGASAGGLEALERLFRAMPVDTGMTFVVIQHLSPDFKSLMDELLERFTRMQAIPVTDRIKIKPNKIYLLPPRKDMVINGDELITTNRSPEKVLSLPINSFFRSLASTWGEKAIAIVLSGTGSDGSAGIMDIREYGGLVLSQNEESSRFDGMPRSAINTGCVDAILAPEAMPAVLLAYASNPHAKITFVPRLPSETPDEGIPAIFERLQSVYDIDFNYYKPQTITRRIERRIALHPEHISIEEYGRRVQKDSNELDLLYKDLLIGVTRFFRDPEAFEILQQQVIPDMLSNLPSDGEIRVWVCACSTGEEAYTIAILFLEAFEQRHLPARIKILATDLHRESLHTAAEGIYSESSFTEMPPYLRDKYFNDLGNNTYKVSAYLRKHLIFSEHNLLKDPPFTRIDLVTCRNLLIYLHNPAQLRSIASFHFALKINGVLLLGGSEGLGELANEFKTLDRHWKIFSKIRDSRLVSELRSPLVFQPSKHQRLPGGTAAGGHFSELKVGRVYDLLLNQLIPSGILVNERFEAIHVFGDAAQFLRAPKGRVTTDLISMVEGNLRISLMTALRNAQQRQTSVNYKSINQQLGESTCLLDLVVDPLLDSHSSSTYYMITLRVNEHNPKTENVADTLTEEVDEEIVLQIQHLERELQQTRESLQSTVEELETSNEELQAANEELLASNEELQSTNEELHSVNEELYSVNAEHEQKILELNNVTGNLDNLIRSTDLATIFIDNDYAIRLFTPKVADIFPILPQDIGRDLRHLQPRQPDNYLLPDLESVLSHERPVERQINLKNQTFLRRVTPYKDVNKQVVGLVLTYVDISELQEVKNNLGLSENKFRLLAENSGDWVFVIDPDNKVQYVSPACFDISGVTASELMSSPDLLKAVIHPEDRPVYYAHMAKMDDCAEHRVDARIIHRDGSIHWIEHHCRPIYDAAGKFLGRCGANRDITERKKTEMELRKLSLAVEQSPNGIIITNLSAEIEYANAAFLKTSGYDRDDIIGKNPRVLQSGKTPEETYKNLWQALSRGQTWDGEFINRKKNGELYIEHEIFAPIRDPDGGISHYLAIKEDISEKKAISDELARHRNHLEELVEERSLEIYKLNIQLDERVQAAEAANLAKSSFLANMSHEIRTPMNAIIGLVYILKRQLFDPDQHAKLSKIGAAADHLLSVINDILDISKIEADKLTLEKVNVDVEALLYRVCSMVISKVQAKGLELIIDAEANLGTFSGDATRLSQGLLNFLSNAIKFTEAGTITLRARIVEQFEHETLLRFEVIDTGIGIKKENMGRLFQIFEQGDNSMTRRYGGTGLGLAITKRIANLMGGEVGADSTEGAGSTFWLTIKLEKNNAQTKSRFMPELLGKRVLVVDDVPTTRLVHTHLMLQVGLECDSVGSGAEAMTALITADQAGKPYHLVLIDMLMPEMDGFELLATLRVSNLSLQPQAWLVTASGESAILENSLPIGFDEVLAKPLSPTLLHESLLRNLPTLINVFTTKSPPSDNHNSQEFAQLIQENFPNIHVLLAEDEPINQEVASMLIEDINWTIDVANNGQEALALAQQNHYDLILMDMQMPVMGGLEATRQIRATEKLRAIPIIAMTANAFIEDRNACLDAGMNDFVTKPVMPELLYETMHRWLNDSKKP